MEEQSNEPNWLSRMHSLLQWKFTAPEPNNPFKPPMSDKVLKELSEEKPVLAKYMRLRGFLDGDEIITFTDMSSLKLETEHPHIKLMPKGEIKKYLEGSGLLQKLDEEMTVIQASFKEELDRRRRGIKAPLPEI